MSKSIFAPSYYQAAATPSPAYLPLSGEISADVCIVGAGYTGLSAAVELAEAGHRVVVLESETVGHGASGRNGGQICTGFSSGQDKIAAQLGKEDARKCFAIAEDSKRLLVDRISRYQIDCDLRWGYLHVLPKPNRMDGLREWKDEWDALGYTDTQIIDKAELEHKLGTRHYHGALREGGAGHFHPLNYCLGLARAATLVGATIHEHSPAIEVDTGSKPFVRTAHGKVNARFVIIACNAYLGRLVPKLYGKVLPVTSYIIATEPLGENRARAMIRDGEAVADTNFIVDYFRLTPDTRMLFGGRVQGFPGKGYLAISDPSRTGPRLTKNGASTIVSLWKSTVLPPNSKGFNMANERPTELRRRRQRKAKLTLLKKRLDKASKSEKAVIIAKVRRLSPGAEQLRANWKVS
jgi:gamma-glutamylputrescine oxidase